MVVRLLGDNVFAVGREGRDAGGGDGNTKTEVGSKAHGVREGLGRRGCVGRV